MKKLLFLLTIISFMSINIFGQAIPKQIDYQGVLKTAAGGIVPDGNYPMTFKIYNDPTGGSALWTETQTIAVANGIFAAHLGFVTPITGVPFDRIQYLGITLGAEPELAPRTTLTPSPYSFMSMDVIDNTVVKSVNGLKDDVNLVAGTNITITPSGNDLTINAGGGGGGTVTQVNTGAGLTGGPISTTGTISIANDGVTSAMIINEPGIAEVRNSTTNSLAGNTTMTSIAALSITIPSAGYIVLEGKTIAWLSGVTGQNEIYMQIDDTEGGSIVSPYWTKAGLQAYASTGQAFFPVSCQRTFSKDAGTYTFYLEAQPVSGNEAGATTNLYTTQFRAIFYPTAYGVVTSTNESSEGVDKSIPLVK
jgi:hypothetical protein